MGTNQVNFKLNATKIIFLIILLVRKYKQPTVQLMSNITWDNYLLIYFLLINCLISRQCLLQLLKFNNHNKPLCDFLQNVTHNIR